MVNLNWFKLGMETRWLLPLKAILSDKKTPINFSKWNYGFDAILLRSMMITPRAGKKEQLCYRKDQRMISCHFLGTRIIKDTQFTWQVLKEKKIQPFLFLSNFYWPYWLYFQVQHYTLYAQLWLIWTTKHYQLLKEIQRTEKLPTFSPCPQKS